MYSDQISRELKKSKVEIGDKIRVEIKKGICEGLLMPRIELGDTNCIVLKLDNGYNIGINFGEIKTIKLLERKNEAAVNKEKKKEKKEEREEKEKARKETKNDIVILGCGGTIASKIEYRTGAVYPAITPEELIASFPELKNKNLRSKLLFQLFSEDMAPTHWQLIADEVGKEIKKGCKGVVLTHGTDTMHYTSAALSFMLKTPVPVVLVGAQRSSDRGSSDNWMNLNSAVLAAESDIAEVSVCMHGSTNDDFCYLNPGTKCRKLHTSRRDAFKTVGRKPIARIWPEKNWVEILSNDYKRRNSMNLEVDTKIDPNVALIYTYPGIKPKFIEKLADFYNGVVIAGTGLGHVPTNPFNDPKRNSILPAIKSLIERDIPVVIAPQTIFGRINMNIYACGRALLETGVIGNYCDWLPEVALVKLMHVLGHEKSLEKIKEKMLTNVAGEITERTEISEF